MSPYANETEGRISQPGLAQPAHVARRASKSKRMWAICLLGILVLGVSLAGGRESTKKSLRLPVKQTIPSSFTPAQHITVIWASIVYIDALGTVTPIFTNNVFSQVSGQVVAVHYAIARCCVHVRA
jgi:multidrug efflux pump subunit AcrA (membrane-fusion protein)